MYKDIYREIYPARSGPVYYCSGCTSWKNEQCSFGFPEAGNDFAMECSVYISNGKPELTAKL
jgi:predicted heme/steroid binding protein